MHGLHPRTLVLALCVLLAPTTVPAATLVAKWERFEASFKSSVAYTNPVQQTDLAVLFVSPLGETNVVPAFWDGGKTWRVRFSPARLGRWTYTTVCSDPRNK